MKKFGKILLILIIIAVLVFLGLRLINTCDKCDKTFVGLGYNVNAFDSLVSEDLHILCEDCAKTHHALSLLAGAELDDFKRVLVPGKWIPGEISFGGDED